MSDLIFATFNEHKLNEIKQLLSGLAKVRGLQEIAFTPEPPETSETLEGNALQKARFVADRLKQGCFADDTGLEIDALGGEPGVYSARYAADESKPSFDQNMDLVLEKMLGEQNRSASFRTVIAFVENSTEIFFEGLVKGEILLEKKGKGGFGYDPIFLPKGSSQSFAEMTLEQKNQISHRGEAIRKLVEFLKKQHDNPPVSP